MSASGSGSGRRRVLVAGASEAEPPPDLQEAADRIELVYADSVEGVAEHIGEAEGIFAWRPERELLERSLLLADRLTWIQSASAGVDALLFPELVESDIVVTNAGGVFDEAMAEFVMGCMLVFAKDLATTIRNSHDGVWEYRNSEPLAGRCLLVVGAGAIGTAVARKAKALGMRVEGVARSGRPRDDLFDRLIATEGRSQIHEHLGDADYIVNALPLTPETRALFDRGAFGRMRPTARFINIGRGGTVDERGLAHALQQGWIAGAALDVFEQEPLPADSSLWGMPNVIVSPHMSGDLVGWERAVVEVFLDNLDRWLRGEPLRNVVHKGLGYVPTG